MPAHVAIETMTLTAVEGDRTQLVAVLQFHSTKERDGMMHSGMEGGVNKQYESLDRLLAASA